MKERTPGWWPKPWGPRQDDRVRHKEPDHLQKRERVYLLVYIIDLVTEPVAKQHYDIRQQDLNIDKLEQITRVHLASFFTRDKKNSEKALHLNELFRIARL
ncbi:hypothetical protein RJ55_07194 [Drechmeria coniospora]|nr:hypothetical protein RJ55_07194 [Drechmeria coniospora]